MKKWLKLLRIKHYIKNILILLPILFAGKLMNIELLINALVGVVTFSLGTSIVYIINDIKDVESDRKHPVKCKRPIASGEISVKQAITAVICLLVIVALMQVFLSIKTKNFSAIALIVYMVINILYSVFGAKKIPLLDIVILTAGFVLRVVYGASITGIAVSSLLYLVIIVGASYLGFGKRRNELIKQGDQSRDVLKKYSMDFLDKTMYSCMTLVIVFYTMWCLERIQMEEDSAYSIWTVPLLMLIIWRYNMLLEGDSTGDPVDVILSDKVILVLGLALAIFVVALVYI